MRNKVKGGLNKNYKVKDLLDLLENYKKYHGKYLSVETVPTSNRTGYRLNVVVYCVNIDDEHNTVTLSNYLYRDNYEEDHSVSAIIDMIKDYPDYNIIIEIQNSVSDIIFKDFARACFCGFDKLRDCVQLFTLTPFSSAKILI